MPLRHVSAERREDWKPAPWKICNCGPGSEPVPGSTQPMGAAVIEYLHAHTQKPTINQCPFSPVTSPSLEHSLNAACSRQPTQPPYSSTVARGSGEEAPQILKRAGLIAERPRAPSEPAVLYLSHKGLETLRDDGILSEVPGLRPPTLLRRARLGVRPFATVGNGREGGLPRGGQGSTQPLTPRFSTWPLQRSLP